jgi:oxygen-independent coproporphyrinogen-3 oxidase
MVGAPRRLRLAPFYEPIETDLLDSTGARGYGVDILSLRQTETLLCALHKNFALASSAEITMEANPDSLGKAEELRELRKLGINRISMGVQSFDDDELRTLGRLHTADEARAAFHRLRDAGFENLGLDLMHGLPGQSPEAWLQNLQSAADLAPEHLSCYGLTLEPGTALEGETSEGALDLPGEDEQARMFLEGSAFLQSQGYEHYEISNFAKPGCRCRHNIGYWTGQDYLGLGPGAVSTIASVRMENPAELGAYEKTLKDARPGMIKVQLSAQLSARDMAKERVMLALRMRRGISSQEYAQWTGRDLQADAKGLPSELLEINQEGKGAMRLGLSTSGMLVSDAIIAHFFGLLDEED